MNIKTQMLAEDMPAQQHSQQLIELIVARITQQGGAISFRDYMQCCLYEPGMGYYVAGAHKLGHGGDFTTAPEISPLFGQTLANHIVDVFARTKKHHILEFGAGSGRLACDILDRLRELNALPEHYFILELSPDLIAKQQHLIRQCHPDLFERIGWLNTLPDALEGVMVANEVCDAMPLHLLNFDPQNVSERFVGYDNGEFYWTNQSITDPRLAEKAQSIATHLSHFPYQTEVNLYARDWLATLVQRLQKGAIFIVDYGYSESEYYQPQRQQGTLRCYFRQQAHDDVFFMPGLQDITAHVDFTGLAEAAYEAGATVAGFHEQSDFLLAGGIAELAEHWQQRMDVPEWLSCSAGLKQLLLPGGLGHQFKVLSLTKDLPALPRLRYADRLYQL